MYWEEEDPEKFVVPDDIVDLSFGIDASTLPLDHASVLSDELIAKLPWLVEEPQAAIHLINYPESGSGWERSEDATNELFFVSRRCRLKLRLPKHRLKDAETLTGKHLDIAGNGVLVLNSNRLPLAQTSTLYAKRVIQDSSSNEDAFVKEIAVELDRLKIRAKKLLCGKSRLLNRDETDITVRSVFLADLSFDDSIRLQQNGIGDGKLYGCGIFIAHKGIGDLRQDH